MSMKMLSAEEEIAYYFWFVLNKIKKQIEIKEKIELQNEKDFSISYSIFLYPTLNDPYKPTSINEQIIIEKFIKDKIIIETRERSDFQVGVDKNGNPESAGIGYFFKVNRSRFDKLHNKYKEIIKQYETAEEKGDTLTFNINGEVSYISPTGELYKTKLTKNSNSYNLLSFLVDQPKKLFNFSELAEKLNRPRGHAQAPSDERRVRDTIQSIKKALKYYGKDLFLSDYGFGIKCKVNIIK